MYLSSYIFVKIASSSLTHFIKQFHFPSQDLLFSLLDMWLNKNLWVFIWISSCDSHIYTVGTSGDCSCVFYFEAPAASKGVKKR